MPALWEVARLIRSKNAGPFELTFDVLFSEEKHFCAVHEAGILSAERFAALYQVPVESVRVFEHTRALAYKISIPRPVFSGDPDDTDVFGGQFHSPLVMLAVPEPAGPNTNHER